MNKLYELDHGGGGISYDLPPESRNIKILLEIMLDNQHLFMTGLCLWADVLYWKGLMNFKESMVLSKYIVKNKPWWANYGIFNGHGNYWWKRSDIKPRIKWLKKHIKKNS